MNGKYIITNKLKIFSAILPTLIIFSCSGHDSDSIIIEDFNSTSYGEWTIEGNSFGDKPAGGENTHQMIGALGSGYACSAHFEEASAKGTLISPSFKIEKKSIHFLIGSQEIHFLAGSEEYTGQQVIQLLVNDEVVRSTVPKIFHAMFWDGWNVEEFIGQYAKIRIVDEDTRDWAHIDIDHIVQNNIPVNGEIIERKLSIDAAKLNIPVNENDPRYCVELYINDRKVREFDVAIALDDIDYWVVTDLSKWLEQDLEIRTLLRHDDNQNLLDEITIKDGIIGSHDLYKEKLRQQFHFSSKRGWINDPNGLVYYDGQFHLFYQHNPYGWDHSRNDYNKTWGHATSSDLVHWNELPAAVHPDHLGPIYSGSAVIDFKNTTGFQSGDHPPMVCLYTSAGGRSPWSINKKFTQSLTYSTDGGKTFTSYKENPVLENLDYINRDPKAIWYEPNQEWVIVLHFNDRAMEFFTSKDLKIWEWQSEFESRYLVDCPELFQLPVDGNVKNKKWVLYGGPAYYYIGEFDGKQYTAETEVKEFNYGNAFYASQTFNNVPDSDGRRIQIGWGLTPTEDMSFNQSLLFPVELTLHNTNDGIRMFAYPVKEIEKLWNKEHSWNNIFIDQKENLLSGIDSELLDISVEFEVSDLSEFGFIIKGKEIKYNTQTKKIKCDQEVTDLVPIENNIKMRILVDRLTIELFANDGQVYMPIRAYPEDKKTELQLFTKYDRVKIKSISIHELKSAWE